jgi:endonuclease/exonuclease/phosphatase family metal-dependent hydrolase
MQISHGFIKTARLTIAILGMAAVVFSCSSGPDNLGDIPDITNDNGVGDIAAELPGDDVGYDVQHDTIADITADTNDSGTPWPDEVTDAYTPGTIVLDASTDTAAPVELPAGIAVRAGVYNVYGYKWATPEQIGAMLASLNLDMIGVVESDEAELATLAASAGYEHFCHSDGGKSLLSRTPLAACISLPLDGGRSIMRTETDVGGVTFAVYVAHTSWDTQGDKEITQFIDEHFVNETRKHVVMVGDFNDEHLSTQITIIEERLVDAFTAFGWYPGERVTWPSTHFDDTEGSQTIDLIFFRNDFRPIVVAADAVNLSPVLSDHKPVWAELLYPANETQFADELTMNRLDPFRAFPPEADRPANLLLNPGAEDGLDGWQSEGGGVSTDARRGCTALQGEKFFAGFEKGYKPDNGWSSFSQTVSLEPYAADIDAGKGYLMVSGQMVTCPEIESKDGFNSNVAQPYDDAEILVTFEGLEFSAIDHFASKRHDTLKWYPWVKQIPITPGTRNVKITLNTFKRLDFNGGIDGGFDDIYAGFRSGDSHRVIEGNLLTVEGVELGGGEFSGPPAVAGDLMQMGGWITRADGSSLSLEPFAPRGVSGHGYFFAGDEVGLNPLGNVYEMAFTINLDDYKSLISENKLALRWGGFIRTNIGQAEVWMLIDLLDRDGNVWARVTGDCVRAAEWLQQEHLTLIPSGIAAVQFKVFASVAVPLDAVFADELFVRPELVKNQ